MEWHPGELFPRVGLDPLCGSSVTNLSRPAERVVVFYDQRGTAKQHIKAGKDAINWTRLSCHSFRNNEVRLQLHALAYNLGNFLRTLALPEAVEHWSLTTLREKLIKIGAKVVRHGRYITFQLAEVAIPRSLFANILRLIDGLRPAPLWSVGWVFDRQIGLIRGGTRPTAPVHDGNCGANALRAPIVGNWGGPSGDSRLTRRRNFGRGAKWPECDAEL